MGGFPSRQWSKHCVPKTHCVFKRTLAYKFISSDCRHWVFPFDWRFCDWVQYWGVYRPLAFTFALTFYATLVKHVEGWSICVSAIISGWERRVNQASFTMSKFIFAVATLARSHENAYNIAYAKLKRKLVMLITKMDLGVHMIRRLLVCIWYAVFAYIWYEIFGVYMICSFSLTYDTPFIYSTILILPILHDKVHFCVSIPRVYTHFHEIWLFRAHTNYCFVYISICSAF